MRCERCGEGVEEYRLGEASAIICPACGFLNVPVDHKSNPQPTETWQEAFDRFYEQFGADEEGDDELSDEETGAEETDDETDPGDDRELTDLEGVGPAVAERLRAGGYDSVSALSTATPEDLEAVEGIGPRLAARLLSQFESA